MKQLDKEQEPYYWDCPRCGTTHHENVLQCEQWTRNGVCGCYRDDAPLYTVSIANFATDEATNKLVNKK